MKKISTVGVFILSLLVVNCHPARNDNTPVNLRYYYKMDFISDPTQLDVSTIEDSTFLSYYKDRIIMKITYHETTMRPLKTDSGTEFTNLGQPVTTRYKYLSFNKGDSIGFLYGYDVTHPPTKVKIDSIWANRITIPHEVITKKVDSLIAVKESKGLRIEYYIAQSKPDASYPDSVIINFSDSLNGIPFSFSEELDKTRKMKLYKIQYIYKAYFDATQNGNMPRREYKFEIGLAPSDEFATKLLK